jgi:hypothetical protein
LLSGRKDQVEFQTQLTTNYPFPIFVESWTRLGQESLEIGTRHVQAIVFEHDIDRPSAQWGTAIGQYRKRWKVWYDPVMGVVGQRELSLGDTKNAELPDETHVIFVSPF